MESLDQIKSRIEVAVPGAKIEIVQNGSPSQQHSLLIDNEHAVAIARFLRVDPALRLDFCSNVTGVDWSKNPDAARDRRAKISLSRLRARYRSVVSFAAPGCRFARFRSSRRARRLRSGV